MSKVLFVTQTHNIWGGMEQWLHNFSAWLQERNGWEVLAALPRGRHYNDAAAYHRAHPHLKPIVLDVRAGSERGRLDELTGAIVESNADLVIPIASGAVFESMRRARAQGSQARLVVPIRSLHPDLFCNVFDHIDVIDRVVAVSRLIEAVVRQELSSETIDYVRHGVRPAHRARSESPGRLRLGFVGRLEQSTKRVFDLIALRDELVGRGVAADLSIYGGGPDEGALRAALPAESFHGVLSQAELYERAYRDLDILLLFSPAEGSPNAVYEAMQHGVVPVISQFLGQRTERIVRDGETGFTFPVGDIASAAAAIEKLTNDRQLLSNISNAARQEVANDTDERMHRDWERILLSAIARPPKASQPPSITPSSGVLDRVLPPRLADAVRRLAGREFQHPDGWSEWPGTAPAARACIQHVENRLRQVDQQP